MNKIGTTICALALSAFTAMAGCNKERDSRAYHAEQAQISNDHYLDQQFRDIWFHKDIRNYAQWADALGMEKTLPEQYNKWMAWVNVVDGPTRHVAGEDYVQILISRDEASEALVNARYNTTTPEEREANRQFRKDLESGELPPGGY